MDENNVTKFDVGDNDSGKYKLKAICNSTIYIKKLADYLPELYYLVFSKSYLEEENT